MPKPSVASHVVPWVKAVLLACVTLRRQVNGGAWTTVRRAQTGDGVGNR